MSARTSTLLAAVVVSTSCATAQAQDVLVSTEWLAEHLDDPTVVVLHVAMGHEAMPEAFIPGATFIDYHTIAVEVDGLSTELPPIPDLEEAFRSVGVSNDQHVVVYGSGSAHLAARVFMTLEYLGHRGKASVLDGGMEYWTFQQRETVPGQTMRPRGSFTASVRDDVVISADELASKLDDPSVTLIDARPAPEYTGERPLRNPRSGHLPGAYNLYWEDLLVSAEEPRLKSMADVQARFDEAGASTDGLVVSYCQIGMRASYTYFISRYLGYDARFYDGSWAEWSRRDELPLATGVDRR
ncbi:MAG: sulfurtransferase [Gemmatimonadetes bacterium]|nr:sulfurtransferase [Gemmatimonadota bacterium]